MPITLLSVVDFPGAEAESMDAVAKSLGISIEELVRMAVRRYSAAIIGEKSAS